MERKTIIKGLILATSAFSVAILPGLLSAATNDAQVLSPAQMRAFIGQEGNCKCAVPYDHCQLCDETSMMTSRKYDQGPELYCCTEDGAEPDDECWGVEGGVCCGIDGKMYYWNQSPHCYPEDGWDGWYVIPHYVTGSTGSPCP